MPVKNLTDNIQKRLPRLGKIRKGGEKVNDGYGPDLDHFRFASDRWEIVDTFVESFGKEPRIIPCYLPYPNPQQAFPVWAEIWNASGLVHRCDGETMTRWLDKDKYVDGSRPCPGGHAKGDYLNDAVGRLDIIIPELVEAGWVGYVTLETHSKNDIVAILSTLEAVFNERRENPLGLKGILFNLRRVKENISIPGYGKRAGQRSRADKWLVKLEPAAEWIRLQIEMAHAAQFAGELPAWKDAPQLPPGEEIIEGEAKEVPSGNGASPKPNSQKLVESQIDDLGGDLWPSGRWDEIKPAIMKSQANPAEVLKSLESRQVKILSSIDEFSSHVAKGWQPEMKLLVPLILKETGEEDFDRWAALRALSVAAKAFEEQKDIPGFEIRQLIDIAMVEYQVEHQYQVPGGF